VLGQEDQRVSDLHASPERPRLFTQRALGDPDAACRELGNNGGGAERIG
jgi:hypothetical protein